MLPESGGVAADAVACEDEVEVKRGWAPGYGPQTLGQPQVLSCNCQSFCPAALPSPPEVLQGSAPNSTKPEKATKPLPGDTAVGNFAKVQPQCTGSRKQVQLTSNLSLLPEPVDYNEQQRHREQGQYPHQHSGGRIRVPVRVEGDEWGWGLTTPVQFS